MYTEYHGGPVAGGTFPAEIWSDYMKRAKGRYCGDFRKPKTPFVSQPFFGHYATSGRGDKQPGLGTATGPIGGPAIVAPGASSPPTAPANGKGKGKFDPNKYETPPQKPPKIKAPTPTGANPGGGTTAPETAPAPTPAVQ